MFKSEDLKFVIHNDTSSMGLQKALDEVGELLKEGYRLAHSSEVYNYDKARQWPWRIPLVKIGTKSIEELERETPEYILKQFLAIPDTATAGEIDAFCVTYNVTIKESDTRPITRYRKLIKEQLEAAIASSTPEQPEESPVE